MTLASYVRCQKELRGEFLSLELKPYLLPEFLRKFGLFTLTPEIKFSTGERNIEPGC